MEKARRRPARRGDPPRVVSDTDAWTAIMMRDAAYDGRFFYAVRTTGVYCRPSCPSRRPRRENVEFFSTRVLAEADGYRACKRCKPGSGEAANSGSAVARAVAFIDRHLDEPITLDRLAAVVRVSPFHLQRTFKREMGLSPKAYQDAHRMTRLRERLRVGDTVSRATYEAGFGSSRAVYEKAAAGLGMSPARYRRGAAGVRIRYALARASIGHVLVAATDRGVTAVLLGDAPAELEASLRGEFPRAELSHDDASLREWLDAIVAHADGMRVHAGVPTDLVGTEFQRRVWRALQGIPLGTTRSYREVAAAIGEPAAVRAVARACATNRAALVVPCHRVVRADGALSGYRWGVDRKRRLLDAERRIAAQRDSVSGDED